MADVKHPLAKCGACTLCSQPFVPSSIKGDSKLVVIGEAPGAEEAQHGAPFVGPSGKVLRALISKHGLDATNDVSYVNVVACRPPNNREPTDDEKLACRGRFEYDIGASGGTLLAVGATAADALNPTVEKISKRRGLWTQVNGRRMMTTWHPAYVLRKQSEMEALNTDIRRAIQGAKDVGVPEPNVRIIRTLSELKTLVEDLGTRHRLIAFDIETDQLRWFDTTRELADPILMLALAWSATDAAIICDSLLYDIPGAPELITQIFNAHRMVGHNSKFDIVFLRSQTLIYARTDDDTMLMHYALNEMPGTHGLKQLSKTYLGIDDYEEEHVQKYLTSRNDTYSKVPFEELSKYAAIDVCVTWRLSNIFEDQLTRQNLWSNPYRNLLMPIANALIEVELNGMAIDANYLKEATGKLEAEMADLKQQIRVMANAPELNINSPMQLAKVLYDQLKLPNPETKFKRNQIAPRATSRSALEQLQGKHPIIDLITKYRRVMKIKTSYLDNLLDRVDAGGRVHATFQVHGTETGRLSVRDPALQTIPRESTDVYGKLIRNAFKAPLGMKLVVADFSQAELRVLAALSGDQFLLNVYAEKRDLHTEVAKAIWGEGWTKENRMLAKMLNFSVAYGGTEYSFAAGAGIPLEAAREVVRKFNANMPRVKQWKEEQFRDARNHGFVQSRTGRRRRFPIIDRENLDEVRKSSINSVVQGLASDVTSIAAGRLIQRGYKVVLLVHDSIIVETPEECAEEVARIVVETMTSTGEELCPEVAWKADCDIVSRWGAKS